MKQWYIGWKIWGGLIFRFLWSSSEFLVWDVTQSQHMVQPTNEETRGKTANRISKSHAQNFTLPPIFLLDSYWIPIFPVDSLWIPLIPMCSQESQLSPSTFLFKVLRISNTPLLTGRGAVTTNFKWNRINKKTPCEHEGCCLLLAAVAGCAHIIVNMWGSVSRPPFLFPVIPVRATPLNIPKQVSCGLYKNSGFGWDEIDGVIVIGYDQEW